MRWLALIALAGCAAPSNPVCTVTLPEPSLYRPTNWYLSMSGGECVATPGDTEHTHHPPWVSVERLERKHRNLWKHEHPERSCDQEVRRQCGKPKIDWPALGKAIDEALKKVDRQLR